MITSMRRCVACDDLWPWPISSRSSSLDLENHVLSVASTVLDGFFPYLVQMITSMRRCVACDDLWPWPITSRSFDLDFENRVCSVTFSVLDRLFFWLGIQYVSKVWVIMRRRGVSSERRRSSCSSFIRLSMITPKTFTLLSELIDTSSHNLGWVTSCWFGDNIINWTFCWFAFMPLSPNHYMAVYSLLANYQEHFEDWKRQTTTNDYQHKCTNCNCWWHGTNHQWKCWTRLVLIWNLVGHLYVNRPNSYDSCLS